MGLSTPNASTCQVTTSATLRSITTIPTSIGMLSCPAISPSSSQRAVSSPTPSGAGWASNNLVAGYITRFTGQSPTSFSSAALSEPTLVQERWKRLLSRTLSLLWPEFGDVPPDESATGAERETAATMYNIRWLVKDGG